ncbi:MAG: hypothetical protein RI900_1339 [Actinomycetota bacterium]
MRRTLLVLVLSSLTACSGSGDSTATTGPTMTAAPTSDAVATTLPSPDPGEPEGTMTFTGLEQTHVDTPVEYPQTPPVGGPHSPQWQTCAFYGAAIPAERGVHSMEHGAVWITHSPDLPAEQVEVLKALQQSGREVLVSPFEGLPTPVVASAWGKQLQLPSAGDPRLEVFVSMFDDGPQTPELGTPCAGGVDETAG